MRALAYFEYGLGTVPRPEISAMTAAAATANFCRLRFIAESFCTVGSTEKRGNSNAKVSVDQLNRVGARFLLRGHPIGSHAVSCLPSGDGALRDAIVSNDDGACFNESDRHALW